MSTVADPATTSPERERFSVPVRPDGPSFGRQISALVRRNLFHIRRQPENLADVTIQPVMFVLLFAFVFGGAIAVAGSGNYREWLLPGIMAQTMAFSSFVVASGLCNDLNKGIIDRFRTLPIQRSSILIARSASSQCTSANAVPRMQTGSPADSALRRSSASWWNRRRRGCVTSRRRTTPCRNSCGRGSCSACWARRWSRHMRRARHCPA